MISAPQEGQVWSKPAAEGCCAVSIDEIILSVKGSFAASVRQVRGFAEGTASLLGKNSQLGGPRLRM